MSQPTGPLPERHEDELQLSSTQACVPCEVDELLCQLTSWGKLWSGESGNQHSVVRERLTVWLERCMGHGVKGLLAKRAGGLTLSTSTPLLAAFLGRRATRELSREVLRDL